MCDGLDSSIVTSQAIPALRLDNVSKHFGATKAVNDLSFTCEQGQIIALLGPNGAGKTTTIEMCEGFQKPDAGSVEVLGMNPATHPDQLRSRIGIMLQGGGAYPGIKVGEMMNLVASYADNPLDPLWLLETVGLAQHQKTSFRQLSGGQQQRLSLACALVNRPELVFLDEPTAGLDTQSRMAVWDLVKSMRRDGVTIVLTTHLLDEAEALADRVIIIDHGQLVAEGTMAELTRATHAQGISVTTTVAPDFDALSGALQAAGVTSTPVHQTGALRFKIDAAATPAVVAQVASVLAEQDILATSIDVATRHLEDVFLELTGREMRK
ncbi:ATP-binding cassette domain-containing protein [Corynebacterium ulceribovis]|uniref:ABC transporter ATP-binding protein n=1 Tax=Corynebacterium ulceribovis TaxID=487732 RepID=UPI000379469E